ncbi:hypothetical protein K1719_001633 [Acacia pycnantha]|nr:hypothetical protein K1719_001633 [Acacia pycnantha]
MEDSGKHGNNTSKFLNPGMLQLQKMGLELTCPLWFVILLSCTLFDFFLHLCPFGSHRLQDIAHFSN